MDFGHKYIVYDVSDALSSGAVEYMGGKPKGWLTFNLDGKDLRVLFKEGRPGAGENWAEKVACELAELLELPQATYELAYLDKDRPCVISPSFLNVGEELDDFISDSARDFIMAIYANCRLRFLSSHGNNMKMSSN